MRINTYLNLNKIMKKMISMEKITTGMTELDILIGGGYPNQTVMLISGSAGTGKTLYGLNFLIDGVKKGKNCCYISFSETKDELLRACDGIDSLKNAKKYLDKNLIFKHIDLRELTLNKFVKILEEYPKIDRLVIDNVNKLLLFAENEKQYRTSLIELINYAKQKSDCTLMLCETIGDEIDMGAGESYECDGVINLSFLDLEEKPMRTLEIHKMRYAVFEPRVLHNFDITEKELKLTKTKIL